MGDSIASVESEDKTTSRNSVFTSNLPGLLSQLNISLVVSTYQAGKVILLRDDGGTINTHFRNFEKPMGIAAHENHLTIGGTKCVDCHPVTSYP